MLDCLLYLTYLRCCACIYTRTMAYQLHVYTTFHNSIAGALFSSCVWKLSNLVVTGTGTGAIMPCNFTAAAGACEWVRGGAPALE